MCHRDKNVTMDILNRYIQDKTWSLNRNEKIGVSPFFKDGRIWYVLNGLDVYGEAPYVKALVRRNRPV